MNASTSGRCRRRWATGVAVQNQSGKRESNPPRRAHETLLEPLQSIPQSGRQESNLPRTAYQAVASPLSPRPEEAPCTGIEPVFPGRQPGRCTPASSQGGRVSGGSRTRLSDAAGRCLGCSATDTVSKGGRSRTLLAPALEAGRSPGSTPLTVSGRDRTRTCKGLRLARLPTGCHRAFWLALPNQAVPAGLEPATVWLTASRTTVVLRDSRSLNGQNRNRT